jgi:solute carrier family 25 ornithine transporter 2/15
MGYCWTGPVRTVICGGIGGVTLWTVIFPTDVVKSRIQINKLNISMTQCMREIVQKEGVRALYNGLGPTVIRTFPATGALFVAYEYTKKFLTNITS